MYSVKQLEDMGVVLEGEPRTEYFRGYQKTPKGKVIQSKAQRTYQITVGGKKASRKAYLQYNYGLSEEDYQDLFEKQDGKCAICSEPGKLGVDHNHTTGQIRGLLCRQCNTAIGSLKESQDLLDSAKGYLKNYVQMQPKRT